MAGRTEYVGGDSRILHIIDALGVGGKERRSVELLKALSPNPKYKFQVVVLSEEIHFKEIYQLPLTVHHLKRTTKKDARVLLRLLQVVRRFRPHIIHVWDSMSAIYGLPAAIMFGAKLVNAMITDADPNVRPFTKLYVRSRITFPFSDVILANSRAGLVAYSAPPMKSRVIHGGFDSNRANVIRPLSDVKEEFSICTPEVVGMVGAFETRKDYRTYLEAAIQILRRRSSVTFVAVGDGKLLAGLKGEYEVKSKGRIVFTRHQTDVQSIINTFNIGVLITDCRFHGEGISNAILEYMGQGIPVVATDSGGTNELVVDGVTGFLVQCAAVAEVVERITQLLDDPALAKTMGLNGRDRVNNEFSIEAMAQRHMSLYEDLIFPS